MAASVGGHQEDPLTPWAGPSMSSHPLKDPSRIPEPQSNFSIRRRRNRGPRRGAALLPLDVTLYWAGWGSRLLTS